MVPDENGSTGSSTSPCSDTFSGPFALSEPECASVDNFLNDNYGIFDAYIAVCFSFPRSKSLYKMNFSASFLSTLIPISIRKFEKLCRKLKLFL